uniref:Protein kinase domain-containing protein n=1 Tax=Macrostomum lignano TaxID=282301 RepID=A0A1I8F6N0_9PLAT
TYLNASNPAASPGAQPWTTRPCRTAPCPDFDCVPAPAAATPTRTPPIWPTITVTRQLNRRIPSLVQLQFGFIIRLKRCPALRPSQHGGCCWPDSADCLSRTDSVEQSTDEGDQSIMRRAALPEQCPGQRLLSVPCGLAESRRLSRRQLADACSVLSGTGVARKYDSCGQYLWYGRRYLTACLCALRHCAIRDGYAAALRQLQQQPPAHSPISSSSVTFNPQADQDDLVPCIGPASSAESRDRAAVLKLLLLARPDDQLSLDLLADFAVRAGLAKPSQARRIGDVAAFLLASAGRLLPLDLAAAVEGEAAACSCILNWKKAVRLQVAASDADTAVAASATGAASIDGAAAGHSQLALLMPGTSSGAAPPPRCRVVHPPPPQPAPPALRESSGGLDAALAEMLGCCSDSSLQSAAARDPLDFATQLSGAGSLASAPPPQLPPHIIILRRAHAGGLGGVKPAPSQFTTTAATATPVSLQHSNQGLAAHNQPPLGPERVAVHQQPVSVDLRPLVPKLPRIPVRLNLTLPPPAPCRHAIEAKNAAAAAAARESRRAAGPLRISPKRSPPGASAPASSADPPAPQPPPAKRIVLDSRAARATQHEKVGPCTRVVLTGQSGGGGGGSRVHYVRSTLLPPQRPPPPAQSSAAMTSLNSQRFVTSAPLRAPLALVNSLIGMQPAGVLSPMEALLVLERRVSGSAQLHDAFCQSVLHQAEDSAADPVPKPGAVRGLERDGLAESSCPAQPPQQRPQPPDLLTPAIVVMATAATLPT